MNQIQKYNLEIAVFVCGAVVMIFELLGSRVAAPYVGTSIYAWTSLIGVILASLSFGYYFGGRLADKQPSTKPLAVIIFLSAIALLATLFLKDAVSLFIVFTPLSIELKSIFISIILFAPTSVLLGMVSPYAVRLRIKDSEKAGSTAGNLYAISTVGSIFGTFLGGFYLVPHFGTNSSLVFLTIILIIISILLFGRDIFSNWFRPVFILPLIVSAPFFYSVNFRDNFLGVKMVADIDTPYNKVWIYESKDQKTNKSTLNLSTDPLGTQGAIFTDGTDDLVFDYTKFYRLAKFFSPNIETALMVGGCVYSYPRDFLSKFPKAQMDVVEIDPGMTEIARKYFGLVDSPRLTIIHEDGRIFLNNNAKKYNAIFIDAFNSASAVPFQLTTMEATQKVYESLEADGILLVNIISSFEGDQGKFFRAEYATYKKIFPQVYAFGIQNGTNGQIVQNIMLVALKTSKVSVFTPSNQEYGEQLSHLWQREVSNDLPILTDDFAPVEYYKKLSL